MNSDRKVYIYGLWDPRDSRLRYLGKTINPTYRLWRHKRDYDNGKITHCSTWIKGVLNDGLEPMMEILEECTEETWREAERDWITKGRRLGLDLVNMVDGGRGGHARGHRLSESTRQKIRAKLLGRSSPMKGKKQTQDAKDKVKQAKLGKKRPEMLGRKLTLEHKQKIGVANAKALKGRKVSEEEKIRLAQIGLARWEKEGEKEKHRQRAQSRQRDNKGQFLPKDNEDDR